MMNPVIHTVGHSNHSLEELLSLLHRHGITAICDVRSQPYSRLYPHFGRERLRDALGESGIAYVYLGGALGGRSSDPGCYANGQVQYDRLAKATAFQRGLERVLEGALKFNVALLCAEKDPLQCHRMLLVSQQLAAHGAEIRHILGSGVLESQQEAEARLLEDTGLPPSDMFRSRAEIVAEAYRRRAADVAYRLPASAGAAAVEVDGKR